MTAQPSKPGTRADWFVLTQDLDTGKFYSPHHEDGSLHGFATKAEAIEAGNELGQTFYVTCPQVHHRARKGEK